MIRVAAGTAGAGAVGPRRCGPSDGHRGLRVHDRPAAGRQRRRRGPALRPLDGRGHRATSRARSSPCRWSTTAGTIGVLEVLDRRGEGGFGLRDIELASVFARQATVAIRSSRVERDAGELLRSTLAAPGRRTTPRRVDAAVAAAESRRLRRRRRADGLWALADAVARARAAAPGEVALVVEILDALARRRPAPDAADVPPVTDRPPGLERAVRRRSPGRPRAPRAVGPRRPRLGVRRRQRPRRAGRDRGLRGRGRRIRRSAGGSCESVAVERDGEDWRVVRRRGRRPRRPRDGVRGDHPRASRPRRSSSRSACSAATTGATAAAFATGLEWAIDRVGRVDRQPVALVAQRRVLRPAPRARRRGVLPERAAGVGREQRRRRELPVAVRGGRVGRGARRRRARRPGSTTPSRRSSSGPTASTSTSPGGAARG